MEIEHCDFPDTALYDLENNVWVIVEDSGVARVGITSVHAALAGKLNRITMKPAGIACSRGQLIATIESVRYFGAVRAPLTGTLVEVNSMLEQRPKLANDSPYRDAWFARIKPTNQSELQLLSEPKLIEADIRAQIRELHVRCFKAYPDYEMWEIGVECAGVLVRLNELIEHCSIGDVVHVVSDDLTADIEMVRWSDEAGQELLESRREGKLFHFIVKKSK